MLRISSPTPGVVLETAEITVIAVPRSNPVFQILESDRTKVVTSPGLFPITIQRTDGLQLSSTLVYTTNTQNQAATVGEVNFDLAQPGIHYAIIEGATVTFAPGVNATKVCLSVIQLPPTPLAFYMELTIQGE